MASPPEALAQAHLEWDTPLYRMAVAQFDQAVPIAQISDTVAERPRYPECSIIVSVPVRSDSRFGGVVAVPASPLGKRGCGRLRVRGCQERAFPIASRSG